MLQRFQVFIELLLCYAHGGQLSAHLGPTLPAITNEVISSARALMMAIAIREGSQDVAPNSERDGRLYFVKTIPVINAVSVIMGNDLQPIS